jgi:hypothetical protein
VKRALIAALVGAAALVASTAGSAGAGAAVRCALPSSAHLLKRTNEAVVYAKRMHVRGAPYPGTATVACAYRSGIPYRLNQRDDYFADGFTKLDPRSVVLAGTIAATIQDPGCGACDATNQFVSVRGLRTGRVTATGPRVRSDESVDSIGTVPALVLKRNGSFAFIYKLTPWRPPARPSGPPSYRVYTESDGRERIVERSAAIDPRSLRLSPDQQTITWLDGGTERQASLP